MKTTHRIGAVGALLDEYDKAVAELICCIETISDNDLITIVDANTTNPDCRSIQTILSHVVSGVYSYSVYIDNLRGNNSVRPQRTFHTTVKEYVDDLNNGMLFTDHVFKNIKDAELEEFDNTKKIVAKWGQLYDIEQLMEHAIVHILRHRRQIERFKLAL